MLKSLKLINWTSHAFTKLEFSKGVNLFVGVMGSGKTSVLEAISYALFGDFPEGVRKRKLRDVIRLNSKNAEVELLFEFEGNQYIVKRTIKPKHTDALLLINGKIAERGTKRINEFIERILNVNYQTFSRIVFAPQNELDNLLLLSPADRKRIMDKLMGIYDMQMVGEKAESLIRKLKNIEVTLLSTINPNELKEKKKRMIELNKKEIDIKKTLKDEKEIIEMLKRKIEKIDEKYENLMKQKKVFDELKREEAKLIGILSNLSDVQEVKEEEIDQLNNELNSMKSRKEKIEIKIKNLDKNIRALELKINTIEQNTKRKEKLFEEYKKLESMVMKLPDIENFEKELDELNKKLINLKSRYKRAEDSLRELEKAEVKCPICLSPLTNERRDHLINIWIGEKDESLNLIKKINQKIIELKEKIKKLTLEEKKQISIKSRIQLIKTEIDKIKIESIDKFLGQKEKLEIELEKKRNELKEVEEKFNRINIQLFSKKKDFERYMIKKKTEKRLKILKDELKTLKFNEDEFNEILKLKREYEVKVSSLKEKLNGLHKEMDLIVSMKKELEKDIKKIEEQLKKLNKIKILKKDLRLFSDAINELQYIVRNELLEALNRLLPEIWTNIYPYTDYRSIKIEATKQTYTFYAHLNSRWVDLSSYASGGERMAFAISLRIALTSLLVPKLGLLILDEPTHNLDENAINKLISLIEEKLPYLIEQTFIITHDERLKSPFASTLYLFKRKKDEIDPTTVEKLNSK